MSKDYSWEEVKKHDKEGDLWTVALGYVYDVTNWENHPGKWEKILGVGGQDMSKNWAGHSEKAAEKRETFKIGRLVLSPDEIQEGWRTIEG